MSERYCKSCRHCTEDEWGIKCSHPCVPPLDYASGERPYVRGVRAAEASALPDHKYYGMCGHEGRLFEPKTAKLKYSFWQRLLTTINGAIQ